MVAELIKKEVHWRDVLISDACSWVAAELH